MKYRVGLLVFSEGKSRQDVYVQRKPMQDRETARFVQEMDQDIEFFLPSCGEIRSKKDIMIAVDELAASRVIAVVLLVPIFTSPALVAHTACQMNVPILVMGNSSKGTFSQLGLLASGGAIDQIGLDNRRIPGDIAETRVKSELLTYLNAVQAAKSLKGSTYGLIGGRSLGISTGTSDPAQWEKTFGVDIEHIDQFEIFRRAQDVQPEKAAFHKEWMTRNYGRICHDPQRFNADHLDRMIRSYLAMKSIILDYELDFVGIKCQPEMSNGFVLQCLTVQLLNDPYDAEGMKQPVACSCEADGDGALTMQIMKLISHGQPTALQDIFLVDDESMVLANCGSSASFFAKLSECPEDNLKEVHLQPHGFGKAGGAATQFVFGDAPFTYARLYRNAGEYHMGILRGQTRERPREALQEYSWYRPTSFVELSIDSRRFLREFGSNHLHCVQGDHVDALIEFCKIKKIVYEVF